MRTYFLRRLRTPAVILATLFCVSAFAFTGNELLANLKEDKKPFDNSTTATSAYKRGIGLGFVMGSFDFAEATGVFCPPTGVTKGQATDIVIAFLEKHPEVRHLSAGAIVYVALKESFPCKK